jgi:hypothetical protein
VFGRIRERKHWFFVHYLPGHASHLRAKELRAGNQVRLIVEAGRNGRADKGCDPGAASKVKPPLRCARSRGSGRCEDRANGRAKPSASDEVCWFAAAPKPGAARTRRREGCKRARSGRGCARVFGESSFIASAPAAWKAGRSAWCRASIRASLKPRRRPGRDVQSRNPGVNSMLARPGERHFLRRNLAFL